MAKLTFNDLDAFFRWIPELIMLAIKNDDIMEVDTADYFHDIARKILPVTRQFSLENPEQRRFTKMFISSIEGDQNTNLQIRPDKTENNESLQQKYLVENSKTQIQDVIEKYMESRNDNE